MSLKSNSVRPSSGIKLSIWKRTSACKVAVLLLLFVGFIASSGCAPRDEQLRPPRSGSQSSCTRNCTPPEFKPLSNRSQQGLIETAVSAAEELTHHLNIVYSDRTFGTPASSGPCESHLRHQIFVGFVESLRSRSQCKYKSALWEIEESVSFQGRTVVVGDSAQLAHLDRDTSAATLEAIQVLGGLIPVHLELKSPDSFSRLKPLANLRDGLDIRGSRSVTGRLVALKSGVFRFAVRADFFLTYYLNRKDFFDEGRVSGAVQNIHIDVRLSQSGFELLQIEFEAAKDQKQKTSVNHFSSRRARGDNRAFNRPSSATFDETLLIGKERFQVPGTIYGYFSQTLL